MFRHAKSGSVEVLLVHPGGPYWARRDLASWSIPKGEYEDGEEPLAAAEREFAEELGRPPPRGARLPLGEVTQKAGKAVTCFAAEGDLDLSEIRSNTFEIEWPRASGQMASFPEVDRAEWFSIDAARHKLNPAQAVFVDRLLSELEST